MSQRFYPRNDKARPDAIAQHRYNTPRNDLSRADGLALETGVYDSPGVISVQSLATIYEGTLASSGWTLGLQITNEGEKWNTTSLRVKSEVAAGVASFGLSLVVGSVVRTSDKLVTVGLGPSVTYVASARADINITISNSAFQRRTIASQATRLLTIEPFSMSYTGPSSIGTALITGTTGIVAQPVFTLQNTLETFHADLTATIVASLFTGIPISAASTFFNVGRTNLTVTVIGSTTVSGTYFRPAFPVTSSFVLRKAAFTTSTLCVIA